ncbi:MAG TPA: enterotoxin, partial [Gemmatimonadaceae bacterium]
VGFEHPLSESSVDGERVRCALRRELPLRPESAITVSSVVGIARPEQMRRDFLAYVERERAHPYRTFLHYNSWYDIGYFSKYSEPEALAVIEAFGTELARERGVTLDSFLFDDGWDDPKTLWGFHAGFPNGFTRVREEATRYGAAPGVWLSPWGGYGDPKKDRLEYGRQQGFETNEGGFALSGPKYYQRFRDACMRMVREYGVNQFKIDGTGNASHAIPGSAFDSDFDAAIHLIEELRAAKPDIYINLTTGTYPSPFWLRYADSIWRGGEDHDFAGVGSDRQQWITYRDGDTYENVVRRGALYPINSLMLHGIIYARHAKKLDIDPHGDFSAEVRSYFGTGTQLQEMYVTPVLTGDEWNTLAECAKWSRVNAGTLVDTHWIGGDPKKLEPYGWASWADGKGIVTLRNPSDRPRRFGLDVQRAFELPPGAPRTYTARSPWAHDHGSAPVLLTGGSEHAIELAPFEVLTLEAQPR